MFVHPAYIRPDWPFNAPQITTQYHKAVFNGRLEKVSRLIESGVNAYETLEHNESLLYVALERTRPDIAKLYLDLYERDLKALEEFFFAKNITNFFWIQETILIAYGKDHINIVKNLAAGLEVHTNPQKFLEENKKGLIVLLKSENTCVPEILWLTPQKKSDAIKIGKIIETIIYDGTLDFQRKFVVSHSFFDIAAFRNLKEILFRMFLMFGKHFLTYTEYVQIFCRLCCHFSGDCVKLFQQLIENVEPIKGVEIDNFSLLLIPMYQNQFEIFEYLLNIRAEIQAESQNTTKNESLSSIWKELQQKLNKMKYYHGPPKSFLETAIWEQQYEFTEKCLIFNPDILESSDWDQTTLSMLIDRHETDESLCIKTYICDNFQMIQEKGFDINVVLALIADNWYVTVQELYQKYPATKNILFRDREKGISLLEKCICGCNFEIVRFLVKTHLDLTTAEIKQLAICLVESSDEDDLLSLFFQLPNAENVFTDELKFHSSLCTALKQKNLRCYKLLTSHFKSVQLKDIQDENGNNLLASVIWSSGILLNPEDNNCHWNKQVLRPLESSDDEAEIDSKKEHNKEVYDSCYNYPKEVSEFDEYQQHTCFDNLIMAEVDHHHINATGQNLIHIATEQNNVSVLKKLLNLKVDPNVADTNKNKPIHLVRSVEVLRVLFEVVPKLNLNDANSDGNTPLLTYLKVTNSTEHDIQIISEMISAGADVTHSNNLGETALHLIDSIAIASHLLENGADVNAQDSMGETAAYKCCYTEPGLLKLYLQTDSIDLLLTTKTGASLLCGIVELEDKYFQETLPAFLRKSKQFDRLFELHCNDLARCKLPILYTSAHSYSNNYCLYKLLDLDEIVIDRNDIICDYADYNLYFLLAKGAHKSIRKSKASLKAIPRTDRRFASTLKQFLEAGSSIEMKSGSGRSALTYITYNYMDKDLMQIMAILVGAGADYWCKNNDERYACDNPIFKCLYELKC